MQLKIFTASLFLEENLCCGSQKYSKIEKLCIALQPPPTSGEGGVRSLPKRVHKLEKN